MVIRYQNLWDASRAELRGNFIATVFTLEMEKSLNNISCYLRKLGRGEQNKPKARRRQEIIKIRAEVKEIETELANANGCR